MRNDPFLEKYMDVLQNIEMTILGIYGDNPGLADHNVDKALDGLVRVYQAEIRGKNPPKLKFTELEQRIYDEVNTVCDVHLGRGELKINGKTVAIEPRAVDEIIACLKRIRRSVGLWTKSFGIRGYLDFITETLAGGGD